MNVLITRITIVFFFVFFLVLVLLSCKTIADDTIYDNDFRVIGTISDDGVLWDRGKRKVGKVDDNGTIWDSPYGGKKIGRVEDNELWDSYLGGRKVGSYRDSDGVLFDENFHKQGTSENKDGLGIMLLRE